MSRAATQPNRYDVFLSHGSPDKPWVRTLHGLLTKAGVSAYLDEVEIEAGDNFISHLSNGVGRTDTFVIVVSQGTMARPWVEHEWTSFMATHGPRNRIIPVLLEEVTLPTFLRPFHVIHAVDHDAERVAARIARAVGKGKASDSIQRYTGQGLVFTVAPVDGGEKIAVTPVDGVSRTVTPPWRRGNTFGIALMDFEKLTREPALNDETRARLVAAAQTLGAGFFELLVSDKDLATTFERATAPGSRAVVTIRSDDDVLLSLPWELLFHAQRFLVRDGILDLVRTTTGAVQFETQLTPPTEPFTLVTNVSAPEGSRLSYEEESFRITHALTDHRAETTTELGTLDDLVETVDRAKPRGIHFSGHGAPGALVFESDEGFEDPVPINRVVTSLRRNGDGALPPFFFLASCHGNTPARPAEGESGSSSSAAQLHRAGVTEVLGYYGPIADELSTRAEEALYAAISDGEPTRLAVGKARAALLRSFDAETARKPASGQPLEHSPTRAVGTVANATHPFAWAQLVFYHRGPEYPLGTPASEEKLRRREAALKRTYRNVADRAFLSTGFIGRRRELHQLRRRRKRGDRVFVLQGLGGLGKTTLAGHLLSMLADAEYIVPIWCRRTEGEHDQAEALVGQLLSYARSRFRPGFEQVVSAVDREAGENAVQRFAAYLQVVLTQQPNGSLVVYLDNLESLLSGPDVVSIETPPDPDAFGSWRSEDLRGIWRVLSDLSSVVENLYVVATCRYRNDDLTAALLPVSPLVDADLFRLMAWFPALRRLSTRTRARLATRLSGHPRAVEFLDDLIAAAIRSWEEKQGEWKLPSSSDEESVTHEWDQLVAPALPDVQKRIWSDLLLAAIWDRVLNERGQRMLFRMTLVRRPWDDDLIAHLGEPGEEADIARRTVRALGSTSLLEQIDIRVGTRERPVRRRFFTIHSSIAAFVRSRFADAGDLVIESHRRIGTHLEEQVKTSSDLDVGIEAGHHLYEAAEYDRASELLGSASDQLRRRGRVWEGIHILMPLLTDDIRSRISRQRMGWLIGTVGLAYAALGEAHRALQHHEQALLIMREVGDRRGEGHALSNLGIALVALGQTQRAVENFEQLLCISREIGDRHGEGGALSNLGMACLALGQARRAIEHSEQALVIMRETSDKHAESRVLGNLGSAYSALGEGLRAIEYYKCQFAIAEKIGDMSSEGSALANLGIVYDDLGETRLAIESNEQALVIMRKIGDQHGEGTVLGNLGSSYGVLGESQRAIELYKEALRITRKIGDRRGEGRGLGGLGAAYAALGEIKRAIELFERHLVIAREIGDRREEGFVIGNLGCAYSQLGDPGHAIELFGQQLIIVREVCDRSGEGRALCNLGSAYLALGDTQLAIEYYKQGLAIGQEVLDPRIISTSEIGLKVCHGNFG